ncbi:glycosyltransferase family 2 protein [Pedobacter glucosidilyticus]|uniref:glycosyltransferase family 2 protein n=1 Tax=Pedobacter glucosidilyticus TaxID=1122941 RepID=UPI0026EA0859|nr:glycosyltransferase family 2 protein [Pedobacter glucosidilyticus]
MKLSIIIVNYNVRDLLQQAIDSLLDACKTIEYEFFVVDNASDDKSVEMLQSNYPEIKLICNNNNVGFSKANNQAIKQATGEYILVVNPDTITSKDTLTKTIDFMDKHPEAGGLGLRMINGQGEFLKESKRQIPGISTVLFHFTGISKLLPSSKFFNSYYAHHIGEFEISEVDILAGAFMLLRKKALAKAGLFDEDFFMYGEDIDLSYRLKLSGFKNYYYGNTYIIHFKGQSTKKYNWRYIKNFYGAILIFARKYFLKF